MSDLWSDPDGENTGNQEVYDGIDDDDFGIAKACSFDTIYEDGLCENVGKFDIQAAKDYLRNYAKKLQSEHEKEKRHLRVYHGPLSFEYMHEMGKAKARSVTPLNNDSRFVKPENDPRSIKDIVDRLYEKSREMQMNGKHRREKIVRMRELSHLLPHERPSLSAKVNSLHSLRSPDSLAQAHIVDRLYGRSDSMRRDGRERIEQIKSKILSKQAPFNINVSGPSPKFTHASEALMCRQGSRLSLDPKEVIDRLYERGTAAEREYGRKRREEIETKATRALSLPRMIINKATTPASSPSPAKRMSCTPVTRRGESPSPDEVMDRLYARSFSVQKDGKKRRELIAAKSNTMFQTHSSPSSSDTKMKITTKYNRDCKERRSPDEVAEQLYGRSYQNQLMGRERRDAINEARELSNVRSPVDYSLLTTNSALVKSARPRLLSSGSSKLLSSGSSSYNDSPSPEEISKRLYDRSAQQQQAGKDRREKVHKERCMSLPRLNLFGSTPVKCDRLTISTTSPKVSTSNNFDRLHGKSLRHVRKDEISQLVELSSALKTVQVRGKSPVPHRKAISYVTAE